jgi:hypothetical protein
MRFTKRLIVRCISATVLGASIAPLTSLSGGATAARIASSPGACAQVRPADVIAAAKTIATATMLRNAPRSPVPSVLRDPADFATFAATTMPRGPLLASTSHPMTPVEFATFRAARLVAIAGLPVPKAISACRSQPSAALKPQILCPQGGCGNLPPHFVAATDTNGNFGYVFTGGQQAGTGTLYASGGSGVANMSETEVTITNLYDPQTGQYLNVPGIEATFTGGITGSLEAPEPAYVPQNGWVVLPRTSYETYIDQSAQTLTVEYDGTGKNYAVVSLNGSGGVTTGYHVYSGGTLVAKTSVVSSPAAGKLPAGAGEYAGLVAAEAALAAQKAGGAGPFGSQLLAGTEQALLDGQLPDLQPMVIEDPSPIEWGPGGGGCGAVATQDARGVRPLDSNCDDDLW